MENNGNDMSKAESKGASVICQSIMKTAFVCAQVQKQNCEIIQRSARRIRGEPSKGIMGDVSKNIMAIGRYPILVKSFLRSGSRHNGMMISIL